jgi:hypothetical protein
MTTAFGARAVPGMDALLNDPDLWTRKGSPVRMLCAVTGVQCITDDI